MKLIKLTKELYAKVSDEDFDYLSQWKWCASRESRDTKWYAIRWSQTSEHKDGARFKIRMHRAVYEQMLGGAIPLGMVIDHDNNDSLDNQRHNLQMLTQQQNMEKVSGWKRRAALPGSIDAIDF